MMGGFDTASVAYKNDVYKSSDFGATATLVKATAEWSARDGHSCVLFPSGDIILHGGYGYGVGFMPEVWRSSDNAATWSIVNASPPFVSSPTGGSKSLTCSIHYLIQIESLTLLSFLVDTIGRFHAGLVYSPTTKTVYMIGGAVVNNQNPGSSEVYVSKNWGVSWTSLGDGNWGGTS
jgi:hypothetical protein